MSDKKVLFTIFTILVGTAAYELTVVPDRLTSRVGNVVAQPQRPIEVVDCLDCMDTLPNSCELESNECSDSNDCSDWLTCVESCVTTQGDANCYDDCDLAHSDVHNECTSVKTCACDVCVGQCVDFCMADDL